MCVRFLEIYAVPSSPTTTTKALEGLTSLSDELADNSGITDPITKWMEDMFGRWGNILLIISVGIAITVLVTCGCCCIPCMRELIQRLITTALTKQQLFYQPVSTVDEFGRHEMKDQVWVDTRMRTSMKNGSSSASRRVNLRAHERRNNY